MKSGSFTSLLEFVQKYPWRVAAWCQAVVATLGSLYFSEVMKLTPCVLCWYQRILMYPLVLIIGVGLIKRDKKLYQYVLPLSVLGTLIAAYHNYHYYMANLWQKYPGIICSIGAPCTAKQWEWLGFVSIPLLSLIAFVVITGLMWFEWRDNQNK